MPASNKVCKSNNAHASLELIADVNLQERKKKTEAKPVLVQINIKNYHVSMR